MIRKDIACFYDMTKEGYTLIEDVEEPKNIRISDLKIVSFVKEGEKKCTDKTIRKRAKKMGANLGRCHARYIIRHQKKIPEAWRDYCFLFPGTIWLHPNGHFLYTPCIQYYIGSWNLGLRALWSGYPSKDRLLRLHNYH